MQLLDTYDFAGVDIAFFSAGGSVSREHAPRAAAAGAVVIDNTSEFRYQDDIPLVISEVNPHAIADYTRRGIIANPNCSTMQMLVALAPIHRAVQIERINVATYQSVSGAGRQGMEELGKQTAALLNFQSVEPGKKFPVQIAFNVIPQIDDFQPERSSTSDGTNPVWETSVLISGKYRAQSRSIPIAVACAGVPTVIPEAAHYRDQRQDHRQACARGLPRQAPCVVPLDERAGRAIRRWWVMLPVTMQVYVGRIREDIFA